MTIKAIFDNAKRLGLPYKHLGFDWGSMYDIQQNLINAGCNRTQLNEELDKKLIELQNKNYFNEKNIIKKKILDVKNKILEKSKEIQIAKENKKEKVKNKEFIEILETIDELDENEIEEMYETIQEIEKEYNSNNKDKLKNEIKEMYGTIEQIEMDFNSGENPKTCDIKKTDEIDEILKEIEESENKVRNKKKKLSKKSKKNKKNKKQKKDEKQDEKQEDEKQEDEKQEDEKQEDENIIYEINDKVIYDQLNNSNNQSNNIEDHLRNCRYHLKEELATKLIKQEIIIEEYDEGFKNTLIAILLNSAEKINNIQKISRCYNIYFDKTSNNIVLSVFKNDPDYHRKILNAAMLISNMISKLRENIEKSKIIFNTTLFIPN